ncbi:winged helix-turn-helix domain-containing protein [Verminephrobacter eiseniae]|uniref:winged helix-turn-helix domain-containing protein n=1 Tax=Verminephrobacter eiseniae TaxID=364317 RepID=UPI00223747AE|nr:crosslink repair DNA glycosylase YcaQ family protein [Verminephrobacter eiseniae]MCW5238298.1 winged helix-turn-helix domain-containing protein [Verminephrobacter eiseniae]
MQSHWRRLALSAQGLASRRRFGRALSGTRQAIEHLGYVQIDTLAVVERAHHHVLWSRVPDYDPLHLNQLISERHIFEYWFHAASYLPMRDYRYALPRMAAIRNGEQRYFTDIDERLMGEILARVRGEGALRVRDIDTGNKEAGHWWNWGPGRRALDKLFMQGDLMACERNGMEKVYDLAQRRLPAGIDLRMPSLREYADYLFDTALRAHGIVTWKQLLHLRTGKPLRDAMAAVLAERIGDGSVQALEFADGSTAYMDGNALEQRPAIAADAVKVLSPFDNLVIHRDRLASLFGFDFRLECYVAAPKRVFGYFCLPILCGDQFVGRVDCKAHRAEQRFEVLSLHMEHIPVHRDLFLPRLIQALQRLADFSKCPLLDAGVIGQR